MINIKIKYILIILSKIDKYINNGYLYTNVNCNNHNKSEQILST